MLSVIESTDNSLSICGLFKSPTSKFVNNSLSSSTNCSLPGATILTISFTVSTIASSSNAVTPSARFSTSTLSNKPETSSTIAPTFSSS